MNRRRFLQALFAIPVAVAPLLALPSIVGPAPEVQARYLDFTDAMKVLKEHYNAAVADIWYEDDPLLKFISERSKGNRYIVPVRYG